MSSAQTSSRIAVDFREACYAKIPFGKAATGNTEAAQTSRVGGNGILRRGTDHDDGFLRNV